MASAQVVRLEITSREPMNNGPAAGNAAPFELILGKVHAEIDPKDPHNTISQDVDLAPRNVRGKGNTSRRSPWPSRSICRSRRACSCTRSSTAAMARRSRVPRGHVSLVSGWQGDVIRTANNHSLVVPIARNRDGSAITGPVVARFYTFTIGNQ